MPTESVLKAFLSMDPNSPERSSEIIRLQRESDYALSFIWDAKINMPLPPRLLLFIYWILNKCLFNIHIGYPACHFATRDGGSQS